MKNLSHENFVNKWWTNYSSPLHVDIEEWVKNSYLSDDAFWKENVFGQQEELLPPSQSEFAKSYDFYHDCIFRHVKTNNTAFSILGHKYPEEWSYKKIHHCVNYHVEEWGHDQLKSGELIAIVGPPNIRFILALFTALRFGLKICYLPSNSPFLGNGLIQKFLAEIKPNYIVSEDPTLIIEGIQVLSINEKASDDENHAPHSFSYPADSEFQISLSLQQQEELMLVPIDAHHTYLCALRDALFTLNIVQYPYWSSPLACPVRTEPCSTFISFLSGTTKIYVADETIRKNPLAIEDERINILGISNELQLLWNQGAGLPSRYLKYYYKNPVEISYQAWKPFVQINKIEKVPQFDLMLDNAMGSAILSSRPTLDSFNAFLKPTLGTSWYLSDINSSGQEALSGYGIFDLKDQPTLGNYTATQVENQLMLTGVVYPATRGVTFPIEQLEEAVAELPFVEDCMLHTLLKTGLGLSHYFVLLVFVNPLNEEASESEKGQWTKEIRAHISSRLGNGYLPDKIDYFALLPKKNILGVDRNWCANQYNSGLLLQKREMTQYKILGALRKLIQQFANQEVS
ncbi:MAG: hypothetical protein H0V82_05450 [Candidatus Protochlamydia sp.]|nr:hypothetical protein [Candidatus Protochlamydia sp.]